MITDKNNVKYIGQLLQQIAELGINYDIQAEHLGVKYILPNGVRVEVDTRYPNIITVIEI